MIINLLLDHIQHEAFRYEIAAMMASYVIMRLFYVISTRLKRYKIFEYYGIPGPKPRLLGGSWLEYERYGNKLLVDVDMRRKYGRVFGIYLGEEPNIMTTDLRLIRGVFLEEKDSFKGRSKTAIDVPLTRGLLFARYHRWRAMRNMLSPQFAKFHRRGGPSSQFIEDTLKMMLDYVDTKYDKCEASGEACILDIRSLMKSTSLHLINTMAIRLPGIEIRENEPNVKALDRFIEEGNRGLAMLAIIFPTFKRFFSLLLKHFEYQSMMGTIYKSLSRVVDGRLQKVRQKSGHNQQSATSAGIGELKPQTTTPDNHEMELEVEDDQLIDTMVRLHHEGRLSRIELLGTAEIILLAGYDTTSTTLAYFFWVIAKNADIQERLRDQLIAHGIESQYLKQVLNETMRLYPVAPYIATRLATRTVTINGYTIPEGTKIVYNSWLVHRDSEIWPDPLRFDPDRFREGADIDPCAFAPFGLGERRCLAYQLAPLEMKMIICDLLLRYRIKLIGPKELDIEPVGFVTTQPKEEVFIELERL